MEHPETLTPPPAPELQNSMVYSRLSEFISATYQLCNPRQDA
jgi:hypothetical protein